MYSKKKVLIIDDEVDLCQLLKSYFLKKGYEVFLSHTLEDGVVKLESNDPDIIFLDNNLPDGSGWQLAVEIATERPHIYITLISGYYPQVPPMPSNAKYSVIEKPVSFTDIEKNLRVFAIA